VLSIITDGGKWVELTTPADALYQHLLLTAERKFWRCVDSGESRCVFLVQPPRPRTPAVGVAEMSWSSAWAEIAAVFRSTGSHLFPFRGPLAQSHARASAVLVNEFHASYFKGLLQFGPRVVRDAQTALSFNTLYRRQGKSCVGRQLRL